MLWSKALGGASAPASYRGVFGGGFTAAAGSLSTMDYINITTAGNATSFGLLSVARQEAAGVTNGSRGVFGGGVRMVSAGGGSYTFTYSTNMNYITIATASNATAFGGITSPRAYLASASGGGRGVFATGSDLSTVYARMDYISIASTASAAFFGNVTTARRNLAGVSNGSRGVFGGGQTTPPTSFGGNSAVIDYITIATTGNATSFGSLTGADLTYSGVSDGSRGVFGGAAFMQYIDIATTGNAIYFGNFSITGPSYGGVSSPVRGVFSMGTSGSMQYITIATTGDSTAFGSLSSARSSASGVSEFA